MISFFGNKSNTIFAVQTENELSTTIISKLNWLFQAELIVADQNQQPKSLISDFFVGPRASMITPWSTNAVEITQNMGVEGIIRIEEFHQVANDFSDFDPMLSQKYDRLNQHIFTITSQPEAILYIDNIIDSTNQEGFSLMEI